MMTGNTEEADEKSGQPAPGTEQHLDSPDNEARHFSNCSSATGFQLTRQYDDTDLYIDVSNSLTYTKSNAASSHSAINTSM
jgi:hypothetical protein